MTEPRPPRVHDARGASRREFLRKTALAGAAAFLADLPWPAAAEAACSVRVTGAPWPSVDGWEHRTIMHFLNTIMPGDDGRPLFRRDPYPLASGGDRTAGAYSACALDIFYDLYYGVTASDATLLASALDSTARDLGFAENFYAATQEQQLLTLDFLASVPALGAKLRDAIALGLAATLGAARNHAVTAVLGWPGPNGGYYEDSRHPTSRWLQPARLTADGNLP